MKTYDTYKPSGIDWIGDIPSHWENRKISRSFRIIGSGTTPKAGDDTYYKDGVINWINTGDLNDGILYECNRKITEQAFEEHSTLKVYPPETLLIAMYGATIGRVSLTAIEGCTNQACCALADSEYYLQNFVFYWFLASREDIINLSYGGGQPNISQEIIRFLKIPCPPLSEQAAIAHYLDEKTAQLDTLIDRKRRLIDLLREEKTALINEAVTKGINPNVPMKDSGIEWLGDIPAHWEVKKLKYVLRSVSGGGTPSTGNPEFWKGNIPWVSPKDMKVFKISETEDYVTDLALANSSTSLIQSSQVLMVVRSGILKHTLPVAVNEVPVTLNQDMKAFDANEKLSNEYLFWLFRGCSEKILVFCNKIGATVDSIEMDYLLNFYIGYSSQEEQVKIINHLETETATIDHTISRIEREIELMQEYRTALISEVVTGKVCVV